MKKLLSFIYILSISFLYAQTHKEIDTANYKKRKVLIETYEAKYELVNKSLKKKHKGKLRAKLIAFYDRGQKNFIKNIRKKRIIFDDRFQNYADSLLQEIEKSNAIVKQENIRLFIARHNTPNAINYGDGTIILNLGLFKYLENEDQLVSVISHEIGHQLKDHVPKNMLHKASLVISSAKRKKALEIKKQKYHSYEKAFGEIKKIIYTEGKAHRKQEMEADSIGYTVYNNTNFSKIEFKNALKILGRLDTLTPFILTKSIYKTIFNLPEQVFNDEWLKMEQFSQYDYSKYKAKIDKDSIRSHPEITERINKLASDFKELNDTISTSLKSKSLVFSTLKEIATQEGIANLHYTEKYGLSVYLTLKKLQKDPTNIYYLTWIGKNFEQIYQAKKKYQLNRYVDRLVPNDQDDSYQQFLSFIWNLRLSEIKNIADYYSMKTH